MKNLLGIIICVCPFCLYSQVHLEEILDSSVILKNNIISEEVLNDANNEKKLDWFDILKINFSQTEKSGMDTVLLDSVYTYKFDSPYDSVLIIKQYINYKFTENKINVSKFISDSVSGEWIHFNENTYYYDEHGNDSLLISNVKDTTNNSWIHDKKTEYDFDSNGNEIYYAFYRWNDALNQWIGSSKTIRNYDKKDNLLLLEFFSWDNDSNKWDMTIKHEYAFDLRGNKILDVSYGRDWQTNLFTPKYKYEYEFDEFGNRIMDANYNWDKEKAQWRGTSKSEGVYDENGNRILSYYYTWDYENDKWKYQQKSKITFYEKRNSAEVYFWNDELSQWYGHWNEDREFNEYGQDSIRIEYNWSFEDTVWYKKSKTEYTYYKPELYPSKVIYKWNKGLNDWELDKKTDLGFDDNDQLILETNYLWDDSLKVWKGDYKTEIYYNDNGDRTETNHYNFVQNSLIEHNIQIFNFDDDSLINKISNETCSGQTIAKQDTDYVQGTGSILWEYQIGELVKWEDGCKIGIKNPKDLSNQESFYFDFKIINPTNANLVVLFKETSGELWLFDDIDLLANTSQLWKRPGWPFDELELVANENEENGILDLHSIDSVQFLIYDLQEQNISGSLLLDNLGTYGYRDTSYWNITDRFQKVYDDHDNLIAERYYNSYNDTLKIYSQNRYDITYDANGNKTSNSEYSWNPNSEEWDSFYKSEWSYDDSNRIISDARYSWDYQKESWSGNSKTEKVFDDSSRVICDTRYFWDYENENWYGNRKTETTYDTNGNKTSQALIYWNVDANKWIPDYKDEYYFNNVNERTKHIYYKWNQLSELWDVEFVIYDTKYNYLLDDSNNLILYESIQWDENLLIWRAIEKNYFYYSTHQMNPTAIRAITSEMECVSVYPNPFRDILVIETNVKELELFITDISGGKIINRQLHNLRNEINLSDLNSGLYVISLNDGKKMVYNQKLIKQ